MPTIREYEVEKYHKGVKHDTSEDHSYNLAKDSITADVKKEYGERAYIDWLEKKGHRYKNRKKFDGTRVHECWITVRYRVNVPDA